LLFDQLIRDQIESFGIVRTIGIGIVAELFQLKGIPFLGKIFDPMNIEIYVLETGIGVLIDLKIIPRWGALSLNQISLETL